MISYIAIAISWLFDIMPKLSSTSFIHEGVVSFQIATYMSVPK